LTVSGLSTTSTWRACSITLAISGASFAPPRRLRESTHTLNPWPSSVWRSWVTKVSSAVAWEMKIGSALMDTPYRAAN
jgi:hypothetical protein